jgi:hypothetical protein
MPKTQEEVFQIVYSGLIFVGSILAIITLFVNSGANANIYISSYSFISAGIILITGFLIHKLMHCADTGGQGILSVFFTNMSPFILLIAILISSLYLVVAFKKKINAGQISDSYGLFSKLSIAFILLQLYVTYNGTKTLSFKETGSITKIYSSFSCLIGVINIIIISIMASILQNFSTDG